MADQRKNIKYLRKKEGSNLEELRRCEQCGLITNNGKYCLFCERENKCKKNGQKKKLSN